MQEIWKEIKGTNNKYFVSNLGNVKSKYKVLTKFVSSQYDCVNIYFNPGKAKKQYVHRLVAEAFIDNPNKFPEINHIDGNKQNNIVDNLEWCTEKENQQHRINELHKDNVGEHNSMYGKSGVDSPKFVDYILQIDVNGNIVGRYATALQAAIAINGKTKYNVGASNISRCLSGKKYDGRIRRSYKGYKWIYEKQYIGGFKTL